MRGRPPGRACRCVYVVTGRHCGPPPGNPSESRCHVASDAPRKAATVAVVARTRQGVIASIRARRYYLSATVSGASATTPRLRFGVIVDRDAVPQWQSAVVRALVDGGDAEFALLVRARDISDAGATTSRFSLWRLYNNGVVARRSRGVARAGTWKELAAGVAELPVTVERRGKWSQHFGAADLAALRDGEARFHRAVRSRDHPRRGPRRSAVRHLVVPPRRRTRDPWWPAVVLGAVRRAAHDGRSAATADGSARRWRTAGAAPRSARCCIRIRAIATARCSARRGCRRRSPGRSASVSSTRMRSRSARRTRPCAAIRPTARW